MTDGSYVPGAPKRSRKKLIFFILLLLLAAGGITATVINSKRVKPIPISTEKAEKRNITQLVTATGKIQPEVLVNISPEVSGEIIELPVKEGQLIKKGELLLRIKPDTYRAQVEEQEAALSGSRSASEEKKTQLEKARLDYERAQHLFQQHLLSETDRKAAQTNYEAAQAVLQSSVFEIQRGKLAAEQF